MDDAKLHEVGRVYVEEGLAKKNFDAIPYADNVELRAPIGPNGSWTPFEGKETLRTQWWAPLPDLVKDAKVLGTYTSNDGKSMVVEFRLDIVEPACTLRVCDRFIVDENGQITSQENYFDPRDLVSPGWRS